MKNKLKYAVVSGGVAAVVAGVISGTMALSKLNNTADELELINASIEQKYGIAWNAYEPDLSVLEKFNTFSTVSASLVGIPEPPDLSDEIPEVKVPLPHDYEPELGQTIAVTGELQHRMRDHRNLANDPGLATANGVSSQWLDIYSQYEQARVEAPVWSVTPGRRVIAEIRAVKNSTQHKILQQNLQYYHARGYTGALMVIEGTESTPELRITAQLVRWAGLKLWITFGGAESLKVSAYPDPKKLSRLISVIAPEAEAWLVAWRRTSGHLLEQDQAYMNYLANSARVANPAIAIIGEAYYGSTASHPHDDQPGWCLNIPQGAGAVMLSNFGYSGINAENVISQLASAQTALPLIALIVGERAYYLTTNPNGLGQARNQAIKEKLESRFLKSGAIATITVQDDGSDRVGGNPTGNLSEILWSELP